jgi:hypothetical protein
MTVSLYSRIDAADKRFDGNVAWNHLNRHLGMTVCRPNDRPELAERFGKWMERHRDDITLNPRGPVILVPPDWFR